MSKGIICGIEFTFTDIYDEIHIRGKSDDKSLLEEAAAKLKNVPGILSVNVRETNNRHSPNCFVLDAYCVQNVNFTAHLAK